MPGVSVQLEADGERVDRPSSSYIKRGHTRSLNTNKLIRHHAAELLHSKYVQTYSPRLYCTVVSFAFQTHPSTAMVFFAFKNLIVVALALAGTASTMAAAQRLADRGYSNLARHYEPDSYLDARRYGYESSDVDARDYDDYYERGYIEDSVDLALRDYDDLLKIMERFIGLDEDDMIYSRMKSAAPASVWAKPPPDPIKDSTAINFVNGVYRAEHKYNGVTIYCPNQGGAGFTDDTRHSLRLVDLALDQGWFAKGVDRIFIV